MKKIFLFNLLLMFFLSEIAIGQPKLSLPTAKQTIFIDFDGHRTEGTSWKNNGSFYSEPSGLTKEQINIIYSRLKPFSINGHGRYSHIVVLERIADMKKLFSGSITLLGIEINIKAGPYFQYLPGERSDRLIKGKSGQSGCNRITINNVPTGFYFIQIKDNSQEITQRVVKV